MARPTPRVPPVMSATLPPRSNETVMRPSFPGSPQRSPWPSPATALVE
jgi:hypothetical protein